MGMPPRKPFPEGGNGPSDMDGEASFQTVETVAAFSEESRVIGTGAFADLWIFGAHGLAYASDFVYEF